MTLTALAITGAAVALLVATRLLDRRAADARPGPAGVAMEAARALDRAELHQRAFDQAENPVDAQIARDESDAALRRLDDLCDRVPDRERPAAWQALRARARAVRERAQTSLDGAEALDGRVQRARWS